MLKLIPGQVGQKLIKEQVEANGLVAAKGGKGTMLIFHDTLVHGSPNNMSPWDRAIFSLILNPISNAYQKQIGLILNITGISYLLNFCRMIV